MNIRNLEIRTEALRSGINLWRVADALGIHDSALSRLLRKELSEAKKIEILKIMKKIGDEK